MGLSVSHDFKNPQMSLEILKIWQKKTKILPNSTQINK